MRVIIILIMLPLNLLAQVSWFEGSWDEAKALAAKEGKYIFVDAYTDWCGPCKIMDQKTFSQAEVGKYINEKYIPIKVEMEKEEIGLILSMKYRVWAYPTFLFFSPKGELLYRSIGMELPKSFLETLETADKSGEIHPGISPDLHLDYPEFYVGRFGTKKTKAPIDSVLSAYLNAQEDLFNEVSWSVMARFKLNEKFEGFFLENKAKYTSLYGLQEIEPKLDNIIYRRVSKAIKAKDEAAFKEVLVMVERYVEAKDMERQKMHHELRFYEGTEDWSRYMEIAEEYIDLWGYDPGWRVNGIAWTVYENVEDIEAINMAIVWMKNVVDEETEYAYLDTYAALLYKAGDLDEALKYANEAIRVGEENRDNTKYTHELIIKINGEESR